MSQILANRQEKLSLAVEQSDDALETGADLRVDVVHTCPIKLSGQTLPWPLYSESVSESDLLNRQSKQVTQDSARRTSLPGDQSLSTAFSSGDMAQVNKP